MDICKTIEKEIGQKVTLETHVENLNVDSLEYLYLLLTLGADVSGNYVTVGDIQQAIA